jgi:DNA-binding transcriptional LysR family regulator
LAVTAPVLFGRMYVMPGIVDYLKQYPDVSISALFLDRVVNLLEEGLDVGVRIGELPDSTMRAIRVGSVRRVLCASPAYLKKHRAPKDPRDISGHTIISASPVTPSIEWRFGAGKKGVTVKVLPRLSVTNNDAAIQAALQGFGMTRLMSYQVASYIATGQLKRILAHWEPAPLPIHVMHLEGRQASAKVRSFVELLVDQLRGNSALTESK